MRIDGQYRFVQLADGREVSSHCVLLAPGVQYRKLDIPGADRLTGRGIYYGAALVEALACKDEEVFIVGGANSAGQAALHFAKYATKVTMLVRGEGLSATMSKYLIDEIARTSNIVVEARTQVLEAMGDEQLDRAAVAAARQVKLRCRRLRCLFLSAPRPSPRGCRRASCATRRDLSWQVRICATTASCPEVWHEKREPFLLESSVPGVFVAGDVRARLGQARCFRGGRGVHRGAVCAPVSGRVLGTLRIGRGAMSKMSEDAQIQIEIEPIHFKDLADALHSNTHLCCHPFDAIARRRACRARHCKSRRGARRAANQPWLYYWLLLTGETRRRAPGDRRHLDLVGNCRTTAKASAKCPLLIGRAHLRSASLPCRIRSSSASTEQDFWALLACCPDVRKIVLADSGAARFRPTRLKRCIAKSSSPWAPSPPA